MIDAGTIDRESVRTHSGAGTALSQGRRAIATVRDTRTEAPSRATTVVRRARSGRAQLNDTTILNAAVALIAEQGWESATLAAVAGRAGLSTRPVYDRFVDRGQLAAAVWQDACVPALVPAMQRLLGTVSGGPGTVDPDQFHSALAPFVRPDSVMRAAATLLIVGGYEPQLREQVDPSLGVVIKPAITPSDGGLTAAQAARNAYAVSVGLGLLLMAQWKRASDLDLSGEISRVAVALSSEVAPTELPAESAAHLDDMALFDTGDPVLDDVLQATLDQVGRYGLERATMQRIARAAGVSEGFVFRRYPTKMDLFLDATNRVVERAGALNSDYMTELAARFSPGVSAATMTREIMRPGIELQRGINLEQVRLTWHNEPMRRVYQAAMDAIPPSSAEHLTLDIPTAPDEVAASLHVSEAVAIGAILLATMQPDAWNLPYDVVTVPLLTVPLDGASRD